MYYLASTYQAIAIKSTPYSRKGYVQSNQRKQKQTQHENEEVLSCFDEQQSQKVDALVQSNRVQLARRRQEQDCRVPPPTPLSPLDIDVQVVLRETIRSYKRQQLVQQMKKQDLEKQQEEAKVYQLHKQRDRDEKKELKRRSLKGSQQMKMSIKRNKAEVAEVQASFTATTSSYFPYRRMPTETTEKTTTSKPTKVAPELKQGKQKMWSLPKTNPTDKSLAPYYFDHDDDNLDEISMIPLTSMDECNNDDEEYACDDAFHKFLCDNLEQYTVSPKTTTAKWPNNTSRSTENLRNIYHCDYMWLKSAPKPIEPWQVRGKEDVQLLLQLFPDESDNNSNINETKFTVIESPLSTYGKSRTQEDIETWMDQGYSMQAIVIRLAQKQQRQG